MERTFVQILEDLNKIYDRIIELQPYLNDPETKRELKELRNKATTIENIKINY